MDLPQAFQSSYNLMNQHPILSLAIASCTLSAVLWVGGYRPSFSSRGHEAEAAPQFLNSVSTINLEEKDIGNSLGKTNASSTVDLKIHRTHKQLSQWVEAIQILDNPANLGFSDAVRQYFIGHLRCYDAHQDTPNTQAILRNIKSIKCRNTEDSVIEVMLRTSNRQIGRLIEQAIETILPDQAIQIHLEWASYPFSSIIQKPETNQSKPLVGEYAGYLACMARMSKVSLTELELKIHSIYLEGDTLWAVWRHLEEPTDNERALLSNAWEGFNGSMTNNGQVIKFKQKAFTPLNIENKVSSVDDTLKKPSIESFLKAPKGRKFNVTILDKRDSHSYCD